MNEEMRRILSEGGHLDADVDLRQLDDIWYIVEASWTVGPHDALLLSALWSGGWSGEITPADVGRYEYEVNDVYLPLNDLASDMETYLMRAVQRGFAFARQMFVLARDLPHADSLVGVVSLATDMDDENFLIQGTVVRFFTTRGDYPKWFNEPEGFKSHAVATLDMHDC